MGRITGVGEAARRRTGAPPGGAVLVGISASAALLAASAALFVGASSPTVPTQVRTSGPAAVVPVDPAAGDRAAGDRTAGDPAAGDQLAVVTAARRCLDARHVPLVANALRHGRPVPLAQAHSWCR